jgi:hypothetical protein
LTCLILYSLCATTILAFTFVEQEKRLREDSGQIRAKEIFTQGRKAVSNKVDVSQIKSFYILFEGIYNAGVELPEKNELKAELSDNALIETNIKTKYSTAKDIRKLKGNSFLMDGKTTHIRLGDDSYFKKSDNPEDDIVKKFKLNASEMLLPITLNFAFVPLEFRFIGVADADNGSKADVLEGVSVHKETFKLLFDKKSHLLIMMIKNFADEDGEATEHRFYFSEFKENQGLMVPHKVTIEGSKGKKYFVERNLKVLKLNPEFPPDTFEIKEK